MITFPLASLELFSCLVSIEARASVNKTLARLLSNTYTSFVSLSSSRHPCVHSISVMQWNLLIEDACQRRAAAGRNIMFREESTWLTNKGNVLWRNADVTSSSRKWMNRRPLIRIVRLDFRMSLMSTHVWLFSHSLSALTWVKYGLRDPIAVLLTRACLRSREE